MLGNVDKDLQLQVQCKEKRENSNKMHNTVIKYIIWNIVIDCGLQHILQFTSMHATDFLKQI